jgi:hypothetical protein
MEFMGQTARTKARKVSLDQKFKTLDKYCKDLRLCLIANKIPYSFLDKS